MEFLWELFMETGAPEAYLLYTRERKRKAQQEQRPAV